MKYDEKRKLLDFSKLLFPGWKYYAEDEMKDDQNKRYKNISNKKKKYNTNSLYSASKHKKKNTKAGLLNEY